MYMYTMYMYTLTHCVMHTNTISYTYTYMYTVLYRDIQYTSKKVSVFVVHIYNVHVG